MPTKPTEHFSFAFVFTKASLLKRKVYCELNSIDSQHCDLIKSKTSKLLCTIEWCKFILHHYFDVRKVRPQFGIFARQKSDETKEKRTHYSCVECNTCTHATEVIYSAPPSSNTQFILQRQRTPRKSEANRKVNNAEMFIIVRNISMNFPTETLMYVSILLDTNWDKW